MHTWQLEWSAQQWMGWCSRRVGMKLGCCWPHVTTYGWTSATEEALKSGVHRPKGSDG